MYKNREIFDYLEDILQSITDIREFTSSMNYEDFVKNKKTVKAVIRCLEVIGEAVRNIPVEIKMRYTELPWLEIAGMRNKLIHEYFGIDMDIVWQTINEDLSPLEETAKKLLSESKNIK